MLTTTLPLTALDSKFRAKKSLRKYKMPKMWRVLGHPSPVFHVGCASLNLEGIKGSLHSHKRSNSVQSKDKSGPCYSSIRVGTMLWQLIHCHIQWPQNIKGLWEKTFDRGQPEQPTHWHAGVKMAKGVVASHHYHAVSSNPYLPPQCKCHPVKWTASTSRSFACRSCLGPLALKYLLWLPPPREDLPGLFSGTGQECVPCSRLGTLSLYKPELVWESVQEALRNNLGSHSKGDPHFDFKFRHQRHTDQHWVKNFSNSQV